MDNEDTTPHVIPIDGSQAAILYSALSVAVLVTREQMKHKSSERYRGAIELQISSYEAERARIAAAFPTLKAQE